MSVVSCIGETNQRRDSLPAPFFRHCAHGTSALHSDSWSLCWCSTSSHYLILIHKAKPICFKTSPYFWQLLHSKYCHSHPTPFKFPIIISLWCQDSWYWPTKSIAQTQFFKSWPKQIGLNLAISTSFASHNRKLTVGATTWEDSIE